MNEIIEQYKEQIKALPNLVSGTFKYGSNVATLDAIGHVFAIKIRYQGSIKAVCRRMPNNTRVVMNENKIIFTKLSLFDEFPRELFIYNGTFRVIAVSLIGTDLKSFAATIEYEPRSERWGSKDMSASTLWEADELEWDYFREDVPNRIAVDNNNSVVKFHLKTFANRALGNMKYGVLIGNQHSDGSRYFNKDGSPYIGPYSRNHKGEVAVGLYRWLMEDKKKKETKYSKILYTKRRGFDNELFSANSSGIKSYINKSKPINLVDKKFIDNNRVAAVISKQYAKKKIDKYNPLPVSESGLNKQGGYVLPPPGDDGGDPPT